jgi:hypothetical protein
MKKFVDNLHRLGYRVCGVYLLDSQFVQDSAKFFSGVMSAMSVMVQLEIPHINVMTKMDLVPANQVHLLQKFFDVDPSAIMEEANATMNKKFHALNSALVRLVHLMKLIIRLTNSIWLHLFH